MSRGCFQQESRASSVLRFSIKSSLATDLHCLVDPHGLDRSSMLRLLDPSFCMPSIVLASSPIPGPIDADQPGGERRGPRVVEAPVHGRIASTIFDPRRPRRRHQLRYPAIGWAPRAHRPSPCSALRMTSHHRSLRGCAARVGTGISLNSLKTLAIECPHRPLELSGALDHSHCNRPWPKQRRPRESARTTACNLVVDFRTSLVLL